MIIYVPSSPYLCNVNHMEADKSATGNTLVGRKKKELTKNIDNPTRLTVSSICEMIRLSKTQFIHVGWVVN